MPILFIVDLEGVIANNEARVDLFMSGEYDEYDEAFASDKVHADIARFISVMRLNNHYVVIFCCRDHKYYGGTVDWLIKNDVDYFSLKMRPEFDYPKTKEPELKLRLYKELLEEFPWMTDMQTIVLEDRDEVIEAYRNAGLTCWQIRNGSIS